MFEDHPARRFMLFSAMMLLLAWLVGQAVVHLSMRNQMSIGTFQQVVDSEKFNEHFEEVFDKPEARPGKTVYVLREGELAIKQEPELWQPVEFPSELKREEREPLSSLIDRFKAQVDLSFAPAAEEKQSE